MKNLSLQFHLDRDEMRGHAAAHGADGTIRIDADAIVISFTLRMATVGGAQVDTGHEVPERLSEAFDRDVAVHSDVVRVPFERVRAVTMRGGVVRSPRLILEVTDESALAALPWSDGGSCMLRLARADGQRLRRWLVEAELGLARVQTRADIGS